MSALFRTLAILGDLVSWTAIAIVAYLVAGGGLSGWIVAGAVAVGACLTWLSSRRRSRNALVLETARFVVCALAIFGLLLIAEPGIAIILLIGLVTVNVGSLLG